MAFSVIASITDLGRQRLAGSIITGKSFQIDQFSVGGGGHDPTDPSTALTPDPAVTTCPSVVFGPEPIDAAALVSQFCPEFTHRSAEIRTWGRAFFLLSAIFRSASRRTRSRSSFASPSSSRGLGCHSGHC